LDRLLLPVMISINAPRVMTEQGEFHRFQFAHDRVHLEPQLVQSCDAKHRGVCVFTKGLLIPAVMGDCARKEIGGCPEGEGGSTWTPKSMLRGAKPIDTPSFTPSFRA